MSLYKEILPLIDYLTSIRKFETYLTFDIAFPMKWALPKSYADETKVLSYDTGDANLKGVSFVCEANDGEVTQTVSKILKIVKLNKERELKERLFKETIERLKVTFEKNDLDKLQKLYIDFEDDSDTKLDIDEHTEGNENSTVVTERES